jgi:branched-chain amino acid transport system substrate-binding protein
MFILKDVIESQGVVGTAETLEADRRKMRDGIDALTETKGLLGTVGREAREAIKPFVFVQAQDNNWELLHNPGGG